MKTIQSPGDGIGLTGPLRVEILSDGVRGRLLWPFRVRLADGREVEVPVGFVTDFASVPRAFWRLIPPWGRYSPAAVVHDYLYGQDDWPKAEADRAFLDLMRQVGVPRWKRTMMYWAVRWFGEKKENAARVLKSRGPRGS